MAGNEATKRVHEGRNVKRFREMFQLKQEVLAIMLGDTWSQKKVSSVEGKETVEPELLEQIAAVLKLPVEAFKTFTDETCVNFINNTLHEGAIGVISNPYNININPIEKWLEALEENRKLYERIIKDKSDTIALLEKLVSGKKD